MLMSYLYLRVKSFQVQKSSKLLPGASLRCRFVDFSLSSYTRDTVSAYPIVIYNDSTSDVMSELVVVNQLTVKRGYDVPGLWYNCRAIC